MKSIILFTLAEMWPWGWIAALGFLALAIMLALARIESRKADVHAQEIVDSINRKEQERERELLNSRRQRDEERQERLNALSKECKQQREAAKEVAELERVYWSHIYNHILPYRSRNVMNILDVTTFSAFMEITSSDFEGIKGCGPVTQKIILTLIQDIKAEL
jgi:hypothetical protein